MRTISFATTQMNLINCVEYLSTIDGRHCLYVMPDSPMRKKQIVELLQNKAYSHFFDKVILCDRTGIRVLDSCLIVFYIFRLRVLSWLYHFDVIITGNYRHYGARLTFMLQHQNNPSEKFVVCDDGLATVVIAQERINEIKTNKPFIFYPNRIERLTSRNKEKCLIPRSLSFFTSYDLVIHENDTQSKNSYQYLKNHLDGFDVHSSLFQSKALLIGQPLYMKGYVSYKTYKEKLIRYAATVDGRIVYYAHPEETERQWRDLEVFDRYVYINNSLPFEIIASLLPKGTRVASFFSSVLMNLRIMNKGLVPECIVLRQGELSKNANPASLLECYKSYRSVNVTFYEFD